MASVHIEHAIRDFDTWKAAFDRDPADRQGSGVQRYSIKRPLDDPNYVLIDLDFASEADAQAFLVTMRGIWTSPRSPHVGEPQARIMNIVEQRDL